MKKLLIVLIVSLLIGCATIYKPTTAMSDWELQNEYNNLQIEQRRLERILTYGGTGYTVTHSDGVVISGNRYTNPSTYVTPNTYTIDQLTEIEKRMQDIEGEIAMRKRMGFIP